MGWDATSIFLYVATQGKPFRGFSATESRYMSIMCYIQRWLLQCHHHPALSELTEDKCQMLSTYPGLFCDKCTRLLVFFLCLFVVFYLVHVLLEYCWQSWNEWLPALHRVLCGKSLGGQVGRVLEHAHYVSVCQPRAVTITPMSSALFQGRDGEHSSVWSLGQQLLHILSVTFLYFSSCKSFKFVIRF